MARHILVASVLMLLINIERTCSLKPPQNVRMVGSKLRWTPSNDDSNVLYSLQYNRNSSSEDKWLNVSGHIRTDSKRFHITPDFYGAIFRVRTEKGSNVSEWQYSGPVKCVNVESCGPLTNLIVTPERISLTIAHMDKSLEDEYGDHLEFNISWKKDSGGNPEEHYELTNKKYKDFNNLESGQNYCFQVKYLLYNNPHGNASKEICRIIPETSEEVRRRVLFYTMLTTVLVLAVCGVSIFVLFKNHKKMKRLLQPFQLEIPDHYREVLYNGFPVQVCPSPSSQSLRSYDVIIVIENSDAELNGQKEEQEERSLTQKL